MRSKKQWPLSQGILKFSANFTRLKILWNELDTQRYIPTCNQMKAHSEKMEADQVIPLLMGLNHTYNVVRSNVFMISPHPNLCQAYSLVIKQETQQVMATEQVENFSKQIKNQTL